MCRKQALIVGAGPAGLTAALEFLRQSDIVPVVIECSEYMGGLSRTVRYKGNRIDIGGHRFFSKSDRVMNWWMEILPLATDEESEVVHQLTYHNQKRTFSSAHTSREDGDRVMLVRPRKSRIYFLGRFFDYPLRLSLTTLRNLGPVRALRILASYVKSALLPIRPEASLEDFLINRFGRELYRTFFKSYTEKVWGVDCHEISAEWGAQRIKGLSLRKAFSHIIKSLLFGVDVEQKKVETSLIERFLYPKFGPGQLWECVAEQVRALGGEIHTELTVERMHIEDGRVTGVTARGPDGELRRFEADYFFSTMPVKDLVRAIDAPVPIEVSEVSEGLVYRDFITVGILVDCLRLTDRGERLTDNWIYLQEPDIVAGRLQIFNNWSPFLVADSTKIWVGLEYFCTEGDALWSCTDQELKDLGAEELVKLGMILPGEVRDSCVLRVEKSYPAYFGTYDRFDEVREYLEQWPNLFLIGRNGMHRYNNQDHSMLTAMMAVEQVISGVTDKAALWAVNTEMEYHEEASENLAKSAAMAAKAGN